MTNVYGNLPTRHLLAAAAVVVMRSEVLGRDWGGLAEALLDRAEEMEE